jgi:hypothetical protein
MMATPEMPVNCFVDNLDIAPVATQCISLPCAARLPGCSPR